MKIDTSLLEIKGVSNQKYFSKPLFRFGKIRSKDKLEFYRQFGALLKAGVDFSSALKILRSQESTIIMQEFYQEILNDIVKGRTIFESVSKNEAFSPYECYSIKIGEETRRLPEVLVELEKFYERKINLRRQVISVLTYPAFVLLITLGVLYFMLNYVVPMFETVFNQFGQELPAITRTVIMLSEKFNSFALVFFVLIIITFLMHKKFGGRESYRAVYSRVLLRIPFFGKVVKKIYLARFCQSMSLLLSAKTSLVTTLDLTGKMIGFYPIEKAMQEIRLDILKGWTLHESLSKHRFFPAKIVALTGMGERINKLDEIYENLSIQYDAEVEHSTKVMGTIIEPVMIIIIGSIVGFIMIALYSPIFNLSKILEH